MKIRILTIAVLLFITALKVQSQDCVMYFPTKKGTVLETKYYDAKDKPTSTSTQTILESNKTTSGIKLEVRIESKPEKSDSVYKIDYSVECENGNFYIEMKNFLDPSLLAAYQGMNITVTADRLDMPSQPTVGKILGDGKTTAVISNQGMKLMTIEMTISNRTIAAIENVTTPAGTYSCYKVTYDINSKFGFMKTEMKGIEWYSKDIGIVKSESYNKKGKLEGYSILQSIK